MLIKLNQNTKLNTNMTIIKIKFEIQAWTNFFKVAHNFTSGPDRARKKLGVQNQSGRPIETQLEKMLMCLQNLMSFLQNFLQ